MKCNASMNKWWAIPLFSRVPSLFLNGIVWRNCQSFGQKRRKSESGTYCSLDRTLGMTEGPWMRLEHSHYHRIVRKNATGVWIGIFKFRFETKDEFKKKLLRRSNGDWVFNWLSMASRTKIENIVLTLPCHKLNSLQEFIEIEIYWSSSSPFLEYEYCARNSQQIPPPNRTISQTVQMQNSTISTCIKVCQSNG